MDAEPRWAWTAAKDVGAPAAVLPPGVDNRWDDGQAAGLADELAQLVYLRTWWAAIRR